MATTLTNDATVPLKDLTRGVRQYNRWANLRGIEAAYAFSEKAHNGQNRASGAPVFSHPTHVARTLVGLRMDTSTIAAGLLHDVLEDTDTSYEALAGEFGEEVASLVEGVTKIGQVKKGSTQEAQAENLRKMIVATARDVRVLLIKLSDRLHNMRTIDHLSADKALRISRETLDIYAPLANRLGMGSIKRELEDHAFRQLDPEVHQTLQGLLEHDEQARHDLVESYCERAKRVLRKAGIKAEVAGRPKHLYSIHLKMLLQHKAFEDINDLNAIRILVPTIQDCYHALGILHTTWTPVPGRFKDYVAVPKMNMYQSLHTTVVVEGGDRLEVQIRTHDMHSTAQLGIAAHWRYKDGKHGEGDDFDTWMDWLRQLLEWQTDSPEPREFMEQLKTDLLPSSVYAFTPKGRVVELPYGATPIDFAYAIHSEIGERCSGAKVNGRLLPLRTPLRQGDEVEIITNPKQRPKHDWLEWAQTGRARGKIRRYLRQQVEQDIKPEAKTTTPPAPQEPAPTDPDAIRPAPRTPRGHGDSPVVVEGASGYLVRFAKCCNPLPGEPIAGYVTRNSGVSVHRADCRSLEQLHEGAADRRIDVAWSGDNRGYFTAALRVQGTDRPNLLADVLSSFSNDHVNIASCNAFRDKLTLTTTFDIMVEVEDQAQLARVLTAIRKVPGVTEAERSSTVRR